MMARTLRDVSFYKHCAEFAAATWAVSAAKTRVSVIETLTRVVPVVVTDLKGAPDDAVLRSALRKKLNQGEHGGELDEDEARAISWIARTSRPVGSLADPAVVCDILDALTVNLNGKPAAPEYFSRRRRVSRSGSPRASSTAISSRAPAFRRSSSRSPASRSSRGRISA